MEHYVRECPKTEELVKRNEKVRKELWCKLWNDGWSKEKGEMLRRLEKERKKAMQRKDKQVRRRQSSKRCGDSDSGFRF